MTMSDPIADLLTRVRNALSTGNTRVDIPASTIKEEICKVLEREGYIEGYKKIETEHQGVLQVSLRYTSDRKPVIQEIRRISKPSLRVYVKSDDIKQVRTGLGVSILSTSRGLMTGKQARQENIGGELLCEVW